MRKLVRPPTVREAETVSNGPLDEVPAFTLAVKPGVSETTVSVESCTARPASSTIPTPLFKLPKVGLS